MQTLSARVVLCPDEALFLSTFRHPACIAIPPSVVLEMCDLRGVVARRARTRGQDGPAALMLFGHAPSEAVTSPHVEFNLLCTFNGQRLPVEIRQLKLRPRVQLQPSFDDVDHWG